MTFLTTQECSQLSHEGRSENDATGPTLSSSVSLNQRPDADQLYRLKLNALVKPYKNAQARSGVSLGVLEINVSALEDFCTAVFDVASQHAQGIAVPEDQSFSMRNEPPSREDLDLIVSFMHRNHFYNIENMSTSILQNWTARGHVVDFFIYKYGINIQTAAHYADFQAAVLEPATVDRAGAASNDVVLSIINQLRDRWGTTYVSQSINWQIWANSISTEPAHRHATLITQPPPIDIIHLFRHSPTDGDAMIASLRQDNTTSLAILDDILQQVNDFEEQICSRLRALRGNLERHRRTARALKSALHPEERPDSLAILGDIPNMPDLDHP